MLIDSTVETPAASLGKRRISPRIEPEKRCATCQIGHWEFTYPLTDDQEQPWDKIEEDDDVEDESDEDVGDWIEEDDGDTIAEILAKYKDLKERDVPAKEYHDQIEAYEGFYIGEWNARIWILGGVLRRCSKSNCDEGELRKAAEFGFEAYNEQLKKENKDHVDLRPRKVVRANKSNKFAAKLYYITVQASDDKFYEVRVLEGRSGYELRWMRLAVHYPQIEETYFSFDITQD